MKQNWSHIIPLFTSVVKDKKDIAELREMLEVRPRERRPMWAAILDRVPLPYRLQCLDIYQERRRELRGEV
jgi:hypothetical protein